MSAPVRITGLVYDPWAAWERREPSPWMGHLADGRWVALTQKRYRGADRGMDQREKTDPDPSKRRDTQEQASVRQEAADLVRGARGER